MSAKTTKIDVVEMFDVVGEILNDDFLKSLYEFQHSGDPEELVLAISKASDNFGGPQKAMLEVIKHPIQGVDEIETADLFAAAIDKYLAYMEDENIEDFRDTLSYLIVYLHRFKEQMPETFVDEDDDFAAIGGANEETPPPPSATPEDIQEDDDFDIYAAKLDEDADKGKHDDTDTDKDKPESKPVSTSAASSEASPTFDDDFESMLEDENF